MKSFIKHITDITEAYSPMHVKQALGIATDKRYKGGNMTGAVSAIEKIKKGLSKHPQVAAVLKRVNEGVTEAEVELDEILDTPKAWNSYMRKNKTSSNRASNERILGKPTPKRLDRTLKTQLKRSKGRDMADRLRDRHWNKAIGRGYVNKSTDESFDLDESQINDITAQYINENNISMEELENMTEEELNELIGKAIGGAFKLGAKAAVGTARLGAKAAVGAGRLAKRAVVNKQGNIRGTAAAKQDKAGDRAEKEARRKEAEFKRKKRIQDMKQKSRDLDDKISKLSNNP